MNEENKFTPEDVAYLKELAKDMSAWGRVSKKVRHFAIWLASGVTAFLILWETIIKHLFKGA